MDGQNSSRIPLNRATWRHLSRSIVTFARSTPGGKAQGLSALLIAVMFGINGLNVVNSYVGRDFITAIENRNLSAFLLEGALYIGVFAASTVVAVLYRYLEESLGLLWRDWLTRNLTDRYLRRKTYFHLAGRSGIANADQRIAEDAKAFTATTLSFALILLGASFTVIAFSGVLWSISPLLFVVTVLYAAGGSFLTIYLGRPLVDLNYNQLDREATFRADLIHVRENAESVALLQGETQLHARLTHKLDGLIANFRNIITVNRNLGFYTTWYNYLSQIIPAAIVGPLFIAGKVEFGVVTQSVMAFTHLLGAFSLIVTHFQSLSAFAAVISRLKSLEDALDHGEPSQATGANTDTADGSVRPSGGIKLVEDHALRDVGFDGLSLRSPQSGHEILKNLCLHVPCGTRLLVVGPNEEAKVALFRATNGIWEDGSGLIARPTPDEIYFIPERPFIPHGTLREFLTPRTHQALEVVEARIADTLRALDLEQAIKRAGGLDREREWHDLFSLGEQQRLTFARVMIAAPRFAFLDRVGGSLPPEEIPAMLRMLWERRITYLTIGRVRNGRRTGDDRPDDYDAVLEIFERGHWSFEQLRPVTADRLWGKTGANSA